MNSQSGKLACLDHLAQALDDVRLRRDRIGANDLRPAERDGLGHRVRTFGLLKHRSSPAPCRERERFGRGGHVLLGDFGREFLSDRGDDGGQRDHAGDRGKAAEERRIRDGAAHVLHREFRGGEHVQPILAGTSSESAKAQLVDAVRGIEQNVTALRAGPRTGRPAAAASNPG